MKMLRKRFIPNEIVDVSGDEVIKIEDGLIVTRWLPIHPKKDVGSGESFIHYKDGYKISIFYDKEGKFLYYYVDIIDYEYDEKEDCWTFIDLLVDVKYDGKEKFEVLDMDELEEAINTNLITDKMFLKAIQTLNNVISLIDEGEFLEKCKLEDIKNN